MRISCGSGGLREKSLKCDRRGESWLSLMCLHCLSITANHITVLNCCQASGPSAVYFPGWFPKLASRFLKTALCCDGNNWKNDSGGWREQLLYLPMSCPELSHSVYVTMEALLAHSFDYLSSYDPSKIRKGLRQVEGLLAQICLSRSKTATSERRRSLLSSGSGTTTTPKQLSDLCDDLAFREFFKLQEGFQWNGKLVCLVASPYLADNVFLQLHSD